MATGQITPPPGFELEQPKGAITPPPGFELEAPGGAKAGAPEQMGTWDTIKKDLGNLVTRGPSAQNPYPGMGMEDKAAATEQSSKNDESRKAAGYSLPYRAIAPVAESVGVNVPGMEKDAKEGNEAGVLGHAIAGAVPAVAPLAAEGAFRGVGAAARPVARGIGTVAKTVGESVDHDLVGLASPRAAHALNYASKVGRVMTKLGQEPAEPVFPGANLPDHPGEFPGAPFPAKPAPELIKARGIGSGGSSAPPNQSEGLGKIPVKEVAQPSKLAPVSRDATRQNIPYAGEQEIAPKGETEAKPTISKPSSQTKAAPSQAAPEKPVAVIAKPSSGPTTNSLRPRQYAGTTDDIRQKPGVLADRLEDHGIQQEMAQDLEKEGQSAESEARRTFIAGNSTGETKGNLIAKANALRDQLKNTPGIPPKLNEDLTDVLTRSLELAKKGKGIQTKK